MTSKQRAYLRSLANTLEPIFQIGKSGISENLIQQLCNTMIKVYKICTFCIKKSN